MNPSSPITVAMDEARGLPKSDALAGRSGHVGQSHTTAPAGAATITALSTRSVRS